MNNEITFDATTHTYTNSNGNPYISVTTLLKKFGLSPDYGMIPQDVLARAAQRGTAIHASLEELVRSQGTNVTTSEAQLLKEYFAFRNIDYTTCEPEVLLYDNNYMVAGTTDLIYLDGNDLCLIDHKTTSTIHYDSVSWQASIYIYMRCDGDILQYYMYKPKVFWYRDGKMEVKDLPLIDYDEVVKLLEAHKNNTPYTYIVDTSMIISDSKLHMLEGLLQEKEMYESYIKNLDKKIDVMVEEVKKGMINEKRKTMNVGDCNFTYTAPTTQTKIDNAKVKEYCALNNIDIAVFQKTSAVKDRLILKYNPSNK